MMKALAIVAFFFISFTNVAWGQTLEQIYICLKVWNVEGAEKITDDVSIVGTPLETLPGDMIRLGYSDGDVIFRPQAVDIHNIDDVGAVYNALRRNHPVYGMILPDGRVRVNEVPDDSYLFLWFPEGQNASREGVDFNTLRCDWSWSWLPTYPIS